MDSFAPSGTRRTADLVGTKHTPGPWEAQAFLQPSENHRGWSIETPASRFIRRIGQVYPLTPLTGRGDPSPEGEANARLIAAAPALLETLIALYMACHDTELLQLARAAIAKALEEPA